MTQHPLLAVGVLLCGLVGAASATMGAQTRRSTPAVSDRFRIVPGVQFGAIRGSTSRVSVVAMFGAGNVKDAPVSIGEGFCTPGTRVLADTPDEIEIAWQDAARTRVAFVVASRAGGR